MFAWPEILAQIPMPCSYARQGTPHAEPTAIAAIAQCHWNAQRYATQISAACSWLAERQQTNGCITPNEELTEPGWGTSWALLLQQCLPTDISQHSKQLNSASALNWLLDTRGVVIPPTREMGHNSMLAGWSWINGTHSWIEPTCLAVLALQRNGYAQHARTREGIELLQDRLLPRGGANYGNTLVLGQELLPHLQPTGMVLLTLAGEPDPRGLQGKARDYLLRELGPQTGAASLAWGLLGLAAQGALPDQAANWLQIAGERVLRRDGSPYRLALLAWAAAVCHDPERNIWPTATVASIGGVR